MNFSREDEMNLRVVNKKVYVVSDIHNDADRFKLLLEKHNKNLIIL